VKALAKLFHLLPVEFSLFFEDQGHDTLAPPNRAQGLFVELRWQPSIPLAPRRPRPFDGEMPRFVVRDQSDKQFGSFRFFWSSMCFPLQFEKPLNICFVLLGRRNDLLWR
jgi:hypothetical protein